MEDKYNINVSLQKLGEDICKTINSCVQLAKENGININEIGIQPLYAVGGDGSKKLIRVNVKAEICN